MNTRLDRPCRYRERGLTMLEVLITIVILAFGLLGIAGLQGRMQVAEIEAYQRAQAIVLLQEMIDRINANRKNAASYVTASALGTGNDVEDCSALPATPRAAVDLCEWSNALLGASEKKADDSPIGAMIGARGCVTTATSPNPAFTTPQEFMVAVVWQGLAPTAAPATTTCGSGSYSPDTTRRAIVARVMIGCLENDPTTGQCCPAGGC